VVQGASRQSFGLFMNLHRPYTPSSREYHETVFAPVRVMVVALLSCFAFPCVRAMSPLQTPLRAQTTEEEAERL
jgi:hypothetical protein